MNTKRFLLPLAALAIAGLLLPAGVRPAYACSCAALPTKDVDVSYLVSLFDAVMVGSIQPADPDGPHPGRVRLEVDYLFKGPPVTAVFLEQRSGTGQVTGVQPDCSFVVAKRTGLRYFLALEARPDGTFAPSGCSSFPMEGPGQPGREDLLPFLEALQRVTGVSALPDTGSAPAGEQPGGGTPWPAAVLESSLGLTLLAGGAWLTLRALRGK